ncbi:MAG: DUF192 domain-containing protein [Phycisphaerales bacterium]|nr:DUF192 domain-containing protein [Phycisphaerales bacterium]
MADSLNTTRRALLLVLTTALAFALSGCSSPQPAPEGFQIVRLNGVDYTLELVSDDATRTVGLGGRESIPEHGGMLFSFPNARMRQFVMRDCLVDIDILFLDASGRIVATHAMTIEEPKKDTETQPAYERRLKKYSSRFPAQFAIEIRGGLLETMTYKPGDKIELDLEYLKSVTQ